MHPTIALCLSIGRLSYDAHFARACEAELATCPEFAALLDARAEDSIAHQEAHQRPGVVRANAAPARKVA